MLDQKIIAEIKNKIGSDKRIVFVSGNFNTIHPGHFRLLKFAAECGDYLIVGVTDDKSNGVLVPKALRLEGIRSISYVDYSFVMSNPPEHIIMMLKPSIVVKGQEHEMKFNPEQDVVDNYGGKLLFSSGEMRFSSVDLLRQEMLKPNLSSIILPEEFSSRHGFSTNDLLVVMEKFKGLRVTILGDLIVDEYISCDPLGMSQEDPTLVVTPIQQKYFLGGAAIVAAHGRSLGADVNYFTVSGKDSPADFAREELNALGVTTEIFKDDSRPTTLKQRFRASGKTLLRVSHLRQHDINLQIARKLTAAVEVAVARSDLVIFSDFNYGCLPQSLVNKVSETCYKNNILMVADSQSSSQMGDVSRFKDMLLLTPTEHEARLALHDFNSGLVVLADKLCKKARAKNVILTLGAEGIIAHTTSSNNDHWVTDRLPAFNTAPKDSSGAGDSLLACCSMAMAVGTDIWKSMYLGSIAAACQVSRVGNTPLLPQDLRQELTD
ncbi:MAG: PfkB family carbohydrate kinase [Nitrospinota bacterium]|nr:PfkB family carbohydrate kinase [Nitrospinota bacterium]